MAALQAEVRASGLGTVRGDCVRGVNSVSGPIFDYQRQLVATLAVVGLEGSIGEPELAEAGKLVTLAAADVSAQIGFRSDAVHRYMTNSEEWA